MDGLSKNVCSLRKEDEFVMKKLISGDDSEGDEQVAKSHIGMVALCCFSLQESSETFTTLGGLQPVLSRALFRLAGNGMSLMSR